MEYRFLGQSGLRVSALGFGTMSFGAEADEATSRALYARCREAGINLFDCADVYAGGRSEEILGRLVRDHRDEVVVTSKAYFPTGAGPNDRGSSRYHLVRAVEASLRRLGTDRIDVYFLHRFDEATPIDETLRTLDALVRQGKILYLGASNFAAWQVMKALGAAAREGLEPIRCLQPMYNLLKRQAEVELLPMAQSEGLGVTTYGPLAGGLLTGKYGVDRRPTQGRLVSNAMYATRYADPEYYAAADRVLAFAEAEGHSPIALSVAWVASHPAVSSVLLGARDVAQLEGSLAAGSLALTPELRGALSALTVTPPPATDRNEESSSHNYGQR
jgi:aryl-alcohol dehydrogenase-like predicted oxidoreductase